MQQIILNKGKDHSLKRRHPWVFSGAIKKLPEGIADGDLVEVISATGEYLGTGHYQKGTIAVRILSFQKEEINSNFWLRRLKQAYELRSGTVLSGSAGTNVYRLVFAEGDGLPGLIIDHYNGTCVMQCHSAGMYRSRKEITQSLQELYGNNLSAVYDKSSETLPPGFRESATDEYLLGKSDETVVNENGVKFYVDWETGQKTGFFVDQRENRKLLATYSQGKSVLNAFSYTGGFSMYSLKAGATEVDSVDISEKAVAMCNRNAELNGFTNHRGIAEDVFKFLKQIDGRYDVIVLDPPAFAKSRSVTHNAVQGYKRINAEAMKRIRPGGILFTFSCSQVIDKYLFYNTVVAAAIEAGREMQVLHHLSQPPDHPVSIFHPEGEYLKGLVLKVF